MKSVCIIMVVQLISVTVCVKRSVSTLPKHDVIGYHFWFVKNITSSIVKSRTVVWKLYCVGLCGDNADCKSIFYNPPTRSCQLRSEVIDSTDKVDGTGRQVYYYYADKGLLNSRGNAKDKMDLRFLFISGEKGHSLEFRQLFLQNGSQERYPHLKQARIWAITYISTQRKVLVATSLPNRIISNLLDSDNITILKNNVKCTGIAIDEGRQLIFLATVKPWKGVGRMTFEGKELSLVFKMKATVKDVVVNPAERMIFACSFDEIISISYESKGKIFLRKGGVVMCLALDLHEGSLYFTKRTISREIIKMSLKTRKQSHVRKIFDLPKSLLFYQNQLFLGQAHSKDMTIIDVGTHKTRMIKLDLPKHAHPACILLCLIN